MDWKINVDAVIKAYKRCLKDNGVFSQTLKIHCLHCKHNNSVEDILIQASSPLDFLVKTNIFAYWDVLKEGRLFWWRISNEWKYKCLTEKIGGENIYTLSSYTSTIDMYERFLDEFHYILEKEEVDKYDKMISILKEERNKLIYK